MKTSEKEITDLVKAWFAISLAFAILLSNNLFSSEFLTTFIIAAIAVGSGFILHELAHKLVAQKYGCFAEFRSFDSMLVLAVVMSFFGFIFAAPGAVMISGYVGIRRNGIISVVGPLTNIVLAFLFLVLFVLINVDFIRLLSSYGFFINTLLGLFNMIPFWNFDGKKVWAWNKSVYFLVVALGFSLLMIRGFIG